MIGIYLLIVILFVVLIFWTWNNVKDFEDNVSKIKFILIGLVILVIVTLILFSISKIGINYPSKEIEKQVRKIAVLIFIPINGFISLPHIAKIKTDILSASVEDNKNKRRIIILGIIILLAIIFEIMYLKDFQNGIIQLLNNRQ